MRLTHEVVSRLARAQSGVVTAGQLGALGADTAWLSRQVRSGAWQRLHRGVLVTYSGPITWRSRAWAALLYAGPGAALSHESAAFLHDFRPTPPRIVEVSVPAGRRIMASHGLQVHLRRTMPPAGGRLRKTWGADTVVDQVAAAVSEDDAVGRLCAAVRAGCPPVAIIDAMARRTRLPKGRLLRDLLAEVDLGIESALERRYHRDVEQRHGLPAAHLQVRQVVDGQWIRADCVYEGLGVRVELDGALAHPGGRTDRDTWRDNAVLIENAEITLRYRWRHVALTPCASAGQVILALRSRGWSAHPHPCSPTCPLQLPFLQLP